MAGNLNLALFSTQNGPKAALSGLEGRLYISNVAMTRDSSPGVARAGPKACALPFHALRRVPVPVFLGRVGLLFTCGELRPGLLVVVDRGPTLAPRVVGGLHGRCCDQRWAGRRRAGVAFISHEKARPLPPTVKSGILNVVSIIT